nr:hypothetical protein [Tanacetum cinerariifolium]
MSMDDLYNNLKVYEPEVKGMSSSNSNTKNMAFLSFTNNSTNGVVNTANGVSTASTQVNVAFFTNIDNLSDAIICVFLASQPNSHQLAHEDLEQIHPDNMQEMDLRWQMAMLTMRARRFLKKNGRKIIVNGNETLGFDMSKVEFYNCHKRRHFAKECRAPRNQDSKHKESTRRSVPVKIPASTALVSCDVPPPYTGNFMPSKLDLSFIGLNEFANKPVAENTKSSEEETKAVRKNVDAPIIEEWVSNNKEENVTQPKIMKKTVKHSIPKIEFVKPRQQEKTARKIVKKVEQNRQNTHRPRANQVPQLDNEDLQQILHDEEIDLRAPRNQDSRNRKSTRRTIPFEETTSNALVSQCDVFGYDCLDDFVDESVGESVVEKPTVDSNEPKTIRKENRAPIIEDWVSESEEEDEPKSQSVKPNFTKIEFAKPKANRKPIEQIRQDTYRSPNGNKRN